MSTSVRIPLVDLVAQHRELEAELVSVFRAALETAGFVGGPVVEKFEQGFARFTETKHCIGVGSGTDALRFALVAAGVAPGDTIITVPNTFIATAEAISQAGAQPDFVDIDDRTLTMDPEKLRAYLDTRCIPEPGTGKLVSQRTGRRVSGVVPVHLYGQPADMDPILELADRFGLIVVEDACQAHGAEYFSSVESHWRKVGSLGHAAAFSFYPGKNLGACGEAGAVTTNNADVAEKIRVLRDHGQTSKYHHQIEGYNGRLDAIQAGILSAKLKRLPAWNARRREAALRYRELLAPLHESIEISFEPSWAYAVYHLFVIRVQERDALKAYLARLGIGTGIHYPIPLHLQEAYRHLGFRKHDFPVSEAVADQLLSLPMYPELNMDIQREIVDKIREFLLNRPAHRAPQARAGDDRHPKESVARSR